MFGMGHDRDMDLVSIYQCLCDRTRLRILAALMDGPLCVCHLQEILEEPQVKVSKHLSYLREHGMVEAERQANWMIYRLPTKQPPQLRANLACLQDCVREDAAFKRDARRTVKIRAALSDSAPFCS
jgi:ArsR family transcriptional regulator